MKILHLADLHLGKRVNEMSMIEDQKYILDQIITLIKEENIIGSIKKNTEKGIYGTVSDTESKAYEIGYRQDVKKGKAYILSNLTGSMKKYEIRISKVVPSDTDVLKSMEIEVTDKRLLNLTNGIIQGMSGSPIIQDGKLIGAVTHVFVDDPTKGYAILMETMIYEMKK